MAELVLSNSKSTARIKGFPAVHGVTTRRFGNFGFTNLGGNNNPLEKENNLFLMKAIGANCFHKSMTHHQGDIFLVNLNGRVDNYTVADALICLRPQNGQRPVLIANTADCPVVFLTNTTKNFIAIIHSGRAETELNVIGGTISKLKSAFEIRPENIIVGIWPGICKFCYPVNLKKAILQQLLEAGIDYINIFLDQNVCSAHSCLHGEFLFSSFRRDRNGERNAAFITF